MHLHPSIGQDYCFRIEKKRLRVGRERRDHVIIRPLVDRFREERPSHLYEMAAAPVEHVDVPEIIDEKRRIAVGIGGDLGSSGNGGVG